MKDPIFKTLKDFLCSKVSSQDTVIAGVSGGIDSSALLFLLSDYAYLYGIDLHIAHFDHGWRKESGEQAQLLRSLVENTLRWPFHLERSKDSGKKRANLEDEARRERLAFFQRVYHKTGASGLLLAHQREDQAETVLKRIFEGASGPPRWCASTG